MKVTEAFIFSNYSIIVNTVIFARCHDMPQFFLRFYKNIHFIEHNTASYFAISAQKKIIQINLLLHISHALLLTQSAVGMYVLLL